MNRQPVVRSRRRTLRILVLYLSALGIFAVLISTESRWLDVAWFAIAMTVLLVFSIRVLLTKSRSGENDATKHGPMAAYPAGWRRWVTDDYPEDKTRHPAPNRTPS